MTRFAVLVGLVASAVFLAIAYVRRALGVPEYDTYAQYLADEQEGEALRPDPYVSSLRDGGGK